jgi:myo-inositol-1(or 4)-monophosphatase
MDVGTLRKIGKRLLKEIPLVRQIPFTAEAIGVGASGDKTFPIDKRAEEIVISGLDDSGEALTVISEEAGINDIRGGGKKALVDPIDGSKNAISGIPFYCTSIAIADGNTIGDIEIAYVVNLISGDEFWAEKGKGAFLKNKRIFTQQDEIFYLTAYEAQSPSTDIPEIIPLLSKSRKTRCLGATALDLAYLALGAVSIFVTPSLSRSFDFAGGWLLTREAGGIFTDIKGDSIETLEISLKKSSSLLASGNKKLHEKALRFLSKTIRQSD